MPLKKAARNTSAFRRAPRVPFRTDEKEPKVRLRTLRLGRPARAAPGARYARRPLKGPRRPFGTHFEPPTVESFVRKRGAKLAPLENPPAARVQPAAGRRLVPLRPTTAVGRLVGDIRRKTTPVPGVRAPCARARRSRAVFRLPVGAARHAKAAVPPRKHFRYGSGDSRAEALRPRRGGWRDAVHPSADP